MDVKGNHQMVYANLRLQLSLVIRTSQRALQIYCGAYLSPHLLSFVSQMHAHKNADVVSKQASK